jgi:hypothetical protein
MAGSKRYQAELLHGEEGWQASEIFFGEGRVPSQEVVLEIICDRPGDPDHGKQVLVTAARRGSAEVRPDHPVPWTGRGGPAGAEVAPVPDGTGADRSFADIAGVRGGFGCGLGSRSGRENITEGNAAMGEEDGDSGSDGEHPRGFGWEDGVAGLLGEFAGVSGAGPEGALAALADGPPWLAAGAGSRGLGRWRCWRRWSAPGCWPKSSRICAGVSTRGIARW